jgi:hypothetical protein
MIASATSRIATTRPTIELVMTIASSRTDLLQPKIDPISPATKPPRTMPAPTEAAAASTEAVMGPAAAKYTTAEVGLTAIRAT